MKATTFSFIFALCLSAKPIYSTSQLPFRLDKTSQQVFDLILTNMHRHANILLPNNVKECTYQYYYNAPFTINYKSTEEAIANLLPYFFNHNKQMLEKIQEGSREAILVIGQTGAGKSTLIGGLLGHKFVLEEQEVIEISLEDEESDDNAMVLVNKNPNAPTIGYSTVASATIFPEVYLDSKTNLAFIDTAGLSDTRKNGEAINTCSAIGLRSLIEQIGSVKCIIGVIDYNLFKVGRASKAFSKLLTITKSLLKNKSFETCTSSMVLAFTKVSPIVTQQRKIKNITKKDVIKYLKKRCRDLKNMEENNQMTEDHKLAYSMYKVLFPSSYGLENKRDVSFFLVSQESLLKQNLVRKDMLPTLQKTQKVDKKDIGLVLEPYFLQKTQDWLTKRAQSVAKDIIDKENLESNIKDTKKRLSFTKEQLLDKKNLLNKITNPDTKYKNKLIIQNLKYTIKKHTQRMKELYREIYKSRKKKENKVQQVQSLNKHEVIYYKSIASRHDKETGYYKYSYNDVSIHHIIYRMTENRMLIKLFDTLEQAADNVLNIQMKDPQSNDRVSFNYKVVSIDTNYQQGKLNITLENNLYIESMLRSKQDMMKALVVGLGLGVIVSCTGGLALLYLSGLAEAGFAGGGLSLGASYTIAKLLPPFDFHIYAKRKDIYHNRINTLTEAIENLKQKELKLKDEQKRLQEETKSSESQLQKLEQDLLKNETLIEPTKHDINTKTKEVKKIQLDLQNFQNQFKPVNEKVKQNEIIPYIITKVAPFIDFHDKFDLDVEACIRYMNSVQDNNNNLKGNTNSKHSDYQPGLWIGNNNNIQDEEETREDDNYNNWRSSSTLTSSLLLGTSILANSLSKKKN